LQHLPPIPRRPRTGPRKRLLAALAAAVLAAGCSDATAPGARQGTAALQLSANVSGTPINTLVVDVTGPGMDRVVYNLAVVNGTASGTLAMPPGPSRTILVKAFDSSGSVTHTGSVTLDVAPGSNPPVSLPLLSSTGDVPVTVTLAGHGVSVTPAAATVAVGGTVQLAAHVVAATGDTVAAQVEWATLDPSRARVSASGLVTGVSAGQALVVATYGGVGGGSQVTVQ